jgi:hypothetical protein
MTIYETLLRYYRKQVDKFAYSVTYSKNTLQSKLGKLELDFNRFRVFWDILPCRQTDVDRRFRVRAASIIRAMSEPSAKR